ncbi:hypothetical protein SELMODRAFT_412901 [Selaginella moellendorffii]|uniref:Bidirectional sugar transporter SWEET n=1 Tax=Selaginella moellendorffii TaxID=88036 RepID=D8RMP6_SELML|nr:hypothetical protein SELMODRAFT_412901 [Selaginella moellendorffii]
MPSQRNNNKKETSQMAPSNATTKRLFHGKAAAFPTLLIDEANRFHDWSLCPKEQHHLRNLQDYFFKETNTANVILCSSEDIRAVEGARSILDLRRSTTRSVGCIERERRHSTAWCNTSSSQLLVSWYKGQYPLVIHFHDVNCAGSSRKKEGIDIMNLLFSLFVVTPSKMLLEILGLATLIVSGKQWQMSTCSWESLVEKNQGNVTAMVMFLSPTPTFWRIINSRDTGSFSPVPYACTLLNCLLWFFYGLPAVTSNNTLIVTINAAGIILECIYLIVFFTFAPATHRGYLSMLLVGVAGFFAAAIAVTLTAFQQEQRAKFVGASWYQSYSSS